MRNKFVCVHGHFYQPPRENPWLGEVETEESAFPYHDWNERIFHECYGPNAASPILDRRGCIRRMADNYEDISFNFGATLLSWLERRHPEIYACILAADRKSVQARGGHGNALAQPYNHVILPLASRRDKLTQVRWGIADFKARFRRDPEGMWLPETAVDEETIETLIAEGVRFTVLSPLQAGRVRPVGGGDGGWEAAGEAIDPTRPYRWPSRSDRRRHLDIFFYHRAISQAIAFERLLDSGPALARRLFEAFRPGDAFELAHTATDGESYGHHHRFGDMALAYALEELKRLKGRVRLTNYGEFLSLSPPRQEVEIRPRTAWSCAHGLGRWSEDCGCSSGAQRGWHQGWRAPLRAALDALAAELDEFFAEAGQGLLRDPWAARDDYVQCVLEPTLPSNSRFLDRHAAGRLSPSEARTALRLCELQRQRLMMYASCGWFFDDVSGIETVQILKYACRAVEHAVALGAPQANTLEARLLQRLSLCKSNAAQYADGAAVYARLVSPFARDMRRGAAPNSPPEAELLRERLLYAFSELQARADPGALRAAAGLLSEICGTGPRVSVWELRYLYDRWRRQQDPARLSHDELEADKTISRLLKFHPLARLHGNQKAATA